MMIACVAFAAVAMWVVCAGHDRSAAIQRMAGLARQRPRQADSGVPGADGSAAGGPGSDGVGPNGFGAGGSGSNGSAGAAPLWSTREMAGAGSLDDSPMPTATVVLELMMVALRGGASIPHALRLVGTSVGGRFGSAATQVSVALLRGSEWETAWKPALASEAGGVLAAVEDALEPAWRHGSSPIPRMEAAVDAIARSQHDQAEAESTKLQTAVLMPVGLCFLPAFILVGVVPVVAGWAAGSWA